MVGQKENPKAGETAMTTRLSLLLPASLILAPLTVLDPGRTSAVEPPTFQTAKVSRGNLNLVVRATGTIEPQQVIDVNAQVEGRVVSFGEDRETKGKSIDYGSRVKEGQLLATIDDAVYRARLEQEQASLQVAEAKLELAKVKLQSAASESQRMQAALKTRGASQAEADAAKSNELVAKANLDIAVAELAKQKAVLRIAQMNLDATRIRSPIDGTIIDRRVNVGQTVVASLNAPSLFLIAADLKKLEIWVSVNEADMGIVQVGQSVRFTVDAFPDRKFSGKVTQKRLNAQMTQNVVIYTVVVSIDNPDDRLLPYMTANVQFEVGQRNAVVLVPNAALNWRPQPEWIAPDNRVNAAPDPKNAFHRRVWMVDGRFVRPIDVQLGLSDGKETEIATGDLKEGQAVVVGPAAKASDSRQSGAGVGDALKRAGQRTVQNDLGLSRALDDSATELEKRPVVK
jgi:HlyD family secretion protein